MKLFTVRMLLIVLMVSGVRLITDGFVAAAASRAAQGDPSLRIRIPERFRLLVEPQFDLRVEATGLATTTPTIRVTVDGQDITTSLGTPEVTSDNDANRSSADRAWTYRKVSFASEGVKMLQAA